MFDLSKDFGAEIVNFKQYLSGLSSDLYLRVTVDIEGLRNLKDENFEHHIFTNVNPSIKAYLMEGGLSLQTKFEVANYMMFSAVYDFITRPTHKFDKDDLIEFSKYFNEDNARETLSNYFLNKYKEEQKEFYDKEVIDFIPIFKFASGIYSQYKAAKADITISDNHMTRFKMCIGKEFMNTCYGKENVASSETKSSGGCYIATCVYKSYDCPEVWCLRRYRDQYLKKHSYGRLFIKLYYATSPKIVKHFGNKKWFNNLFRPYLDKKVDKLKKKGYELTPYIDE